MAMTPAERKALERQRRNEEIARLYRKNTELTHEIGRLNQRIAEQAARIEQLERESRSQLDAEVIDDLSVLVWKLERTRLIDASVAQDLTAMVTDALRVVIESGLGQPLPKPSRSFAEVMERHSLVILES